MREDSSILNNSNGNNDDADIIATTGPETESEAQPEASLKGEHYLIELRRARVAELWAQGLSQQRIASDLHVSQQLISTDIKWLKQQAREQIHLFVTEKLPVTVAKTFVSLDLVTTKLWATVAQAEREGDNKIKLQALSQVNQVEAQKIDIVSNLGIVDSVVGAAEQRQQQVSDVAILQHREEEPEENTDRSEFRTNGEQPEEPAPTTKARAIPVDDSGEDN